MHSHTKHSEIKHHFIQYHITKGDIELKFIDTSNQIADVFSKPLVGERFNVLVREFAMLRGRDLAIDEDINSGSSCASYFSHS